MSVLVRCEKAGIASPAPACNTSTKTSHINKSNCKQNICPSMAVTCSLPCLSPCEKLIYCSPCSKRLVQCRMVQGGYVWNGVRTVHCFHEPQTCSTICYY